MVKSLQFIIITLSTFLLSTALFAKKSEQSLDRIAAVVNDSAITQSEIDSATNTIKAQMQSANTPIPKASVLEKKVIDQVIDRKLELQAAEQAGVKISDAEVDQTINNIAKENGLTTDVLYEKVATQHLTREDYRKEIREELTIQHIQQQLVGSKVIMKPEEVKQFMRSKEWQTASTTPRVMEYHMEDLLVLIPDAATPDDVTKAKAAAEALFIRAKQGKHYDTLINPAEKSVENNDLGWRKINEIPSAFVSSITHAKKGSVIAPIQTANGFHIIRLIDTRQEKSASTSATPIPTEKEAEQLVYQRKFGEVLKKWLAKLRSQAVIQLHPDSLA